MKKLLILGSLLLVAFVVFGVGRPANAAKPEDPCHYVTKGNIPYPAGHYLGGFLTPGYDVFGYNYQGHIFNGSLANAYLGRSGLPPYLGDDASYLSEHASAASKWYWQFRNVQLQMKWNDAWLANSDCGTQDQNAQDTYDSLTDPDGYLDRHYQTDHYIGSGAWLTNHATGTYESENNIHWDVTGTYDIAFTYSGSDYHHDAFLTDTAGSVTGNGGYPVSGPYDYPWSITSGTVIGNQIALTMVYTSGLATGVVMHMTGTIAPDGTMSGDWDDNYGGVRNGTWSTSGKAKKVYDACPVDDFVKIIAPPTDAYLDAGTWYTADGKKIGPSIWGSFAIIQEIASDPCGEYGVINYMSPFKKGLGNWED